MKPATPLNLQVRSLAKLVDDGSSPLLAARIHPDAAELLEARAMEQRPDRACLVRIASEILDLPAEKVGVAVRAHFAAQAQLAGRSLREHRRNGLKALAISLFIVAALLLGAESLHALGERRIYRLLSESLVIIGWVTLWIPVESLIFESLSRRRRLRILRALAQARVDVVRMDQPAAPHAGPRLPPAASTP